MSSHREAPEISKDPVADSTDTYAFVSPDDPSTVTIISNYIPLENPDAGPNFFEFGDDVLYSLYIDNDGDADADITYQFEFSTQVTNPNTFLYNTGPISSLTDPNWNRRQTYSVTRVVSEGRFGGPGKVIGNNLPCPPCNIGPRSTPNYAQLAADAVQKLPSGETVFCGQRNDGFLVDLGAVFDLGDIRPIQNLHLIKTGIASADNGVPSVDSLSTLNVHTIAIQIPINLLTKDGSTPTNPLSAIAVLGIWASASRQKVRVINQPNDVGSGPWTQVSRLGNPLFNEVLVPMAQKDEWNRSAPTSDAKYLQYVEHPELATLIPALYPGEFTNLAAITAARADLVAILLTGIPSGIVSGFQNYTGKTYADMLRLNVAIPPASSPNPLGVVGGDLAGYPNGRRVTDDVVTIELKAIAGATYPLVDSSYTVDPAVADVTTGLVAGPGRFQSSFPYLGLPHDGFDAAA
jgi:hypothetical protein